MARFLTITKSNDVSSTERKRTISAPGKIGKITSTLLLGSLVCCASVMYIFQVNQAATMGYEIKKQEKTIEGLKQESENLKIKSAELKSIYNIEDKKEQMQMKAPDEVSYIEIEENVAMN